MVRWRLESLGTARAQFIPRKKQLENGDALLFSDSPQLPLFTAQHNDFSLPVSGGDIPATAVKHIQQRFASASSSAYFKEPNGSLHPANVPLSVRMLSL